MESMLYCANELQDVMKVLLETKTVIGKGWKEQRNKQVEKNMQKLEEEKLSKRNARSLSPSRISKTSKQGATYSGLSQVCALLSTVSS